MFFARSEAPCSLLRIFSHHFEVCSLRASAYRPSSNYPVIPNSPMISCELAVRTRSIATRPAPAGRPLAVADGALWFPGIGGAVSGLPGRAIEVRPVNVRRWRRQRMTPRRPGWPGPNIDTGGEFDVRRMFQPEPLRINPDGPFRPRVLLLPQAIAGKATNSPPVSTFAL